MSETLATPCTHCGEDCGHRTDEIEALRGLLTELADHFDPAGACFQLRGWQELEADLRQFRSGAGIGSQTETK